ncbi:hypothetical protein H8N03_18465 [Ramlibacter sp. USB13]|uniref:Uncharacterized protein n=1 Tax=Ramlibacter cellulosilyticus TaxID=2764187 RepID=A0A923MSC7_9BURK|nr:hypothetical protein [Ramlibacter cellulosilyticus]MBC5784937.1 hypothetical protein [Ramlibacter cellulosilyticus]
MDKQWRSAALFAAGAMAAALAVTAYVKWSSPGAPPEARGFHVAAAPPAPAEPVPIVAQPVTLASSCPAQALANASDDADGRFTLEPVLANANHADASAFLAVAKEATGEGRLRDAEVALLAACHIAEKSSGPASTPLADVKSQLGQHYVLLAAREDLEATREGLLQRASTLFSQSAGTYATALGRNASKTRLAEQRLAALQAPETLHAALRTAAPLNETTARVQEPSTATMGAAPTAAPRRGSAPELVRSDPELAQLEHDIERLRAQAASVTRDRGGMQQRDAQALAQRDARCQDKACLLQWYAQRRAQLLDEF